jgi:hypothetical protein
MRSVVYLLLPPLALAQSGASRDEVLRAMRKATSFFVDQVSTEGGYHFLYTDDLSFGRSESGQGPTQIEFQRAGTPAVTSAYLQAYAATKDRLYLEAARKAGHAYVRGQLCSGGWDYLAEFDPEKRKQYEYRLDNNCGADKRGVTNLDDNVTQSAVRMLMRLDHALGFKDREIHDAVKYALDKLVEAQYPNGAWPQRFKEKSDHSNLPVKRASYPDGWSRKWPGIDYQQHYTFNDNTLADAIDMMLEAARIYKQPKYLNSAKRGGEFILLAQMPDPQPAWAQQYDVNMHPAWARAFEPPSVTGGETQSILRILMVLYRETGDKKYLEPIPRALAYLKRSILPPTANPSEVRRRVGDPALARFYELRTNRPLYITKGSRVQAPGLGNHSVDGYEISYDDRSVITHYSVLVSGKWLTDVEEEYQQLLKADAATLRRPDVLTGLSPWSERTRGESALSSAVEQVRRLIESMDERGAWVTEGTIGKADRLVLVYAAHDMVLRIGRGGATGGTTRGPAEQDRIIQLKENDTVEIFKGAQPPRERIIDSQLFADNLTRLARYVAEAR